MDETLRRLERIFQESGSSEDEARLLRERVRVGVLTQRQIELASYLEYPAARFIIETPITICSILGGTEHPGTIAESWEAALDPFDILFAAAISAANAVVERCGEGEEAGGQLLELMQYYLTAAIRGFENRESPMTYGYDSGIMQQTVAQYMRSEVHFAMYCIYNLCESFDAYLNHIEDQMYSHARAALRNALAFFWEAPRRAHRPASRPSYEREMLCARIGRELVPWLLSEWPPTPEHFVELNFQQLPWEPEEEPY